MSTSLPSSVPGYDGPMTLTVFLQRCLGLRVHYVKDASAFLPSMTTASSASALGSDIVYLQSTPDFAVVVYVAQHASAPPPRQVVPLAGSSPFFLAASSLVPPGLRLTRALLQHPSWGVLFAQLGPALTHYLFSHCAVLAQFEPRGGALFLFGRSLRVGVPPAVTPFRRRADSMLFTSRQQTRKRPRSQADSASAPGARPAPRRPRVGALSRAPSSLACIGQLDVPRTVLAPAGTAATRTTSTARAVSPSLSSDAIPSYWIDLLWLQRHPVTLPRLARQHGVNSQHEQQATARNAGEGKIGGDDDEGRPLPILARSHSSVVVSDARLDRLFPYSLSPKKTGSTSTTAHGLPSLPPPLAPIEASHDFSVREHLRNVVESALEQLSHADLRGAVLRHTHRTEEAVLTVPAGCLPPAESGVASKNGPSSLLSMSVSSVVVSAYVCDVLSGLSLPAEGQNNRKRTAPRAEEEHGASTRRSSSHVPFWGVDGHSAGENMRAIRATVREWLDYGKRGSFPLSRFLHHVRVGQIPWLNGFYTKPADATSSSARCARQQRSTVQQRVFLQWMFFVMEDVVPFLVHRSFHVTWSSRSPNQFVYIPLSVWRHVVRRELNTLVRSPTLLATAPPQGGTREMEVTPRVTVGTCRSHIQSATVRATVAAALTRVYTGGLVWRKSIALPSNAHSVLYAAIRFLPDKGKLRPIAVMRCGSAAGVARMARGRVRMPSPPFPLALEGLLKMHEVTRWLLSSTSLSASVAAEGEAPKWVCVSLPATPSPLRRGAPSVKAPDGSPLRQALRCLVCGVQELCSTLGLHKVSNASHQDEYVEVRRFAEECRRVCGGQAVQEERIAFPSLGVSLVRGDATRCYDRLPQEAVLRVVERLVHHDWYYTVHFTALKGTTLTAPLSAHDHGLHRPDCSAAPHAPSDAGGCHLTHHTWSTTVSDAEYHRGVLPHLPAGWIVWEETGQHNARGQRTGRARTTPSGRSSPADDAISGAEVRAVLRHHLAEHLVVVQGKLFVQHTGIVQGSPVAMLLCDVLLHTTVESALGQLLAEHEEPALLLRRVDDVLVASLSPVAGRRCWQAMREGWPEVGYVCQPAKLCLCEGTGAVSWCGLLIDADTMEVGVEWARLQPLLHGLSATGKRSDLEVLWGTERLLNMVRLRTPATVFCRRLNSFGRVVQTVYEVGLLWSRFVLHQTQHVLPYCHPRVRLLTRPLGFCVARLQRLLRRHRSTLASHSSFCDLTPADVELCVVVALHRTLQSKLRFLLLPNERRYGHRPAPSPTADTAQRLSSQGGHRRFWHTVAHAVRGRVEAALERHAVGPAVEEQPGAESAAQTKGVSRKRSRSVMQGSQPHTTNCTDGLHRFSPASCAALLMEDGPHSLSARALSSVKRA